MKTVLSPEDIEFIREHHGTITVKQISDRRKVRLKTISAWCKENEVYPVGFSPEKQWGQGKKSKAYREALAGCLDFNIDYSPI